MSAETTPQSVLCAHGCGRKATITVEVMKPGGGKTPLHLCAEDEEATRESIHPFPDVD